MSCIWYMTRAKPQFAVQTSTVMWLTLVCVVYSWIALISGTRFSCQGFSWVLLCTKSACPLLFQQGPNTFEVRTPTLFVRVVRSLLVGCSPPTRASYSEVCVKTGVCLHRACKVVSFAAHTIVRKSRLHSMHTCG